MTEKARQDVSRLDIAFLLNTSDDVTDQGISVTIGCSSTLLTGRDGSASRDPDDAQDYEQVLRLPSQSVSTDSSPSSSDPACDSNKRHQCSLCSRSFQRPSALRIHMYSHTGEKPFECSYRGCQKRFNVESNLRRHLRTHLPLPQQSVRGKKARLKWVNLSPEP